MVGVSMGDEDAFDVRGFVSGLLKLRQDFIACVADAGIDERQSISVLQHVDPPYDESGEGEYLWHDLLHGRYVSSISRVNYLHYRGRGMIGA